MAIMNVNPTRMELKNLKKRLLTARRGHKLLKDKRDELMRQFLAMVRENMELRLKVESAITEANRHMITASAMMPEAVARTALLHPRQEVTLEVGVENVMSVLIPRFDSKTRTPDVNDIYSYGFAFTSGDLDAAIASLSSVLGDMLKLAEIEKSTQLLAAEIEKTRRRVNALEHTLIPQLEETIRYITMKLEENDRANTTRLMKVKDMMLEKAYANG